MLFNKGFLGVATVAFARYIVTPRGSSPNGENVGILGFNIY